MLTGLVNEATAQIGLFDDGDRPRRQRLMKTIEEINTRMGSGTVTFAAQGIQQTWKIQRGHLSPSYTTSWDQLMTVRAK